MKKTLKSLIFAALALLAFSCGGDEPEVFKPSLKIETGSLDFFFEGGSSNITFTANMDWTASCDASWLQLSPKSGSGSTAAQNITVTASGNDEYVVRNAVISISVGTISKNVLVSQAAKEDEMGSGFETVNIQKFRNMKDSATDWYRITGEVISIENSEYGDFYIMDDTGYLYVYGLAANKGGDNKVFSTLGISAGDIVTIIATHYTHKGIIEANGSYLESKKSGSYPGYSAPKASASWLELPETSGTDTYEYLCHLDNDGRRNYSVYYDKSGRVAHWVAYPYCYTDKNNTGRSDAYAYDPLIAEEDQPNLSKSYQLSSIGGETFVRGHMVPSYDRGGRRNLDLFLGTNIMPQSDTLNSGSWGKLEGKVRSLSHDCDTLYTVVGTFIGEEPLKVKDNVNRDVTVPDGVYRAVLAYSKDFGYKGLAAYFLNRKSDADADIKSKTMSIDELEKKIGVDLFVNLPDDIEAEVEAQTPSDDSWWKL